jgi:hypothetical protein
VTPERRKIWNDPDLLEKWTNDALDASGPQEDRPLEYLPPTPRGVQISNAKAAGDLDRLRNFFPEIAEFINPPRRKPGQRKPQFDPFTWYATEMLLNDVREIGQLWHEHFGRRYAPTHGPTALDIVIRRWKLVEKESEQLQHYRKNRHRRR